jgi:hypothetical protein
MLNLLGIRALRLAEISGPVFLRIKGDPALFIEFFRKGLEIAFGEQVFQPKLFETALASGELATAPGADFHRASQGMAFSVGGIAYGAEVDL